VFAHRFGRSDEGLSFARSKLLVVGLRNHSPAGVELVSGHVGDLHQHGGDQVDALEHLEVDVHVEGNLALLLHLFLFGRTLVVTLKLTNNDGNKTKREKSLRLTNAKYPSEKKKNLFNFVCVLIKNFTLALL